MRCCGTFQQGGCNNLESPAKHFWQLGEGLMCHSLVLSRMLSWSFFSLFIIQKLSSADESSSGHSIVFIFNPSLNEWWAVQGRAGTLTCCTVPWLFAFGHRECEVVLGKVPPHRLTFWVGECLYWGRSKGLWVQFHEPLFWEEDLIIWLYLNLSLTDCI